MKQTMIVELDGKLVRISAFTVDQVDPITGRVLMRTLRPSLEGEWIDVTRVDSNVQSYIRKTT